MKKKTEKPERKPKLPAHVSKESVDAAVHIIKSIVNPPKPVTNVDLSEEMPKKEPESAWE